MKKISMLLLVTEWRGIKDSTKHSVLAWKLHDNSTEGTIWWVLGPSHIEIHFRQSYLIWQVCDFYCNWNWAPRNKDGAKLSCKFALASHILTCKLRGFRVVDVARILQVWQTIVKKIRHFFTGTRSVDYLMRWGRARKMDGKLAFNFVHELKRSMK